MKKLLFCILLLVIPFIVYAEECSPNNIIIESIELKNTTGNAEEIAATIENKKINIDVKLKDVGDSAEYEVKVKNQSIEEYYLNDATMQKSNEYINYSITYEGNNNIVQPKSEKNLNIKVEYRKEIPEDLLENNQYVENNTITLDIENEKEEEKPITINPQTFNTIPYIVIVIISMIILLVLLREKKKIKYMILLLGIISMIPIAVSAICKANIECETNVIIDTYKPICKRASLDTLHTDTCDTEAVSGYANGVAQGLGCKSSGYYVGGAKNTTTVTYGNQNPTDGVLSLGDAFDCDVNNDGTYDPETERFYYLYDYFDTQTKTFDTNYAVLIYYRGSVDGTPSDTGAAKYFTYQDALDANPSVANSGTSYPNFVGPVTGIKHLPKTSTWREGLLKTNVRAIYSIPTSDYTQLDTTACYGQILPTAFSYGDCAARMATVREIYYACFQNTYSYNFATNCEFILEKSAYVSKDYKFLIWFENPTVHGSGNIYDVNLYNNSAYLSYTDGDNAGIIKPTIEILKTEIEY